MWNSSLISFKSIKLAFLPGFSGSVFHMKWLSVMLSHLLYQAPCCTHPDSQTGIYKIMLHPKLFTHHHHLISWASICSQSCEGPFPFPPIPPLPFFLFLPSLPCLEAAPSNTAGGLGSAVSSPSGVRPGRKRILGAFRAQNRVWWQQCDMPHNHSLIINIHWLTQRLCSLCFITVLQTFCEGPNNGGHSLAKFHEGQDPQTLTGSTPMS